MRHHRSDTRSQPRRSHFHQTTVPQVGLPSCAVPCPGSQQCAKAKPRATYQASRYKPGRLSIPFLRPPTPKSPINLFVWFRAVYRLGRPDSPMPSQIVSRMAPNPRFAAHGGLSPPPTPFSGPESRQISTGPGLTSCDSAPSLYYSMTTFPSVVETSTIAK